LHSMQNAEVEGVIGDIKFNDNGDMTSNILLYQYQRVYDAVGAKSYVAVQVGTWLASTGQLHFEFDKFDWSPFRRNAAVILDVETVHGLTFAIAVDGISTLIYFQKEREHGYEHVTSNLISLQSSL
jgi:hypothetical protein